jgi:hypothetical protein
MNFLKGRDLHYDGVDIEYDEDTGDCECEDICRCGTIVNERVTSVDINHIVKLICGEEKSVTIRYCVDRILRTFKIYDPDKYDIIIENGYYGQEIEEVTLSDGVAKSVDVALKALLELKTDKEKLLFILGLEYGFITPLLKGRKFKIKEVSLKDISEKSKRLVVKKVDNYDLIPEIPVGIVIKQVNKYTIIDGHHRISFLQQKEKSNKKIKVYHVI